MYMVQRIVHLSGWNKFLPDMAIRCKFGYKSGILK